MTERRYLYSLEEIKARLQGRALDLARHLAPGGRLVGPHWMARSPLRSDASHAKPLVNVRKGVWKDWASGEGGDMLHFVAQVACAGDYKKAIPWAKDFLGLTGRAPDPAEAKRFEEQAKKEREDEEQRIVQRRKAALAIMLQAHPLDGTDPASLYLKARFIDVTKLPGGIPRALRFHPRLKALPENTFHPAMVAFITLESLPRGFAGCHRTYLSLKNGVWGKSEFPDHEGQTMSAKRALGAYGGGSIRLTAGKSGKPLAELPKGEWLSTAEGIENGLTVAVAQPEMRVIAHVGITNLGKLVLPEQLGGVYVVQDNDDKPRTKKQFAAGVELLSERHELAIVSMDGEYKDVNDVLTGKRRPSPMATAGQGRRA